MKIIGLLLGIILKVLIVNNVQATDKVEARWLTYLSGEDTVRAYFSVPAGEGPFPGVILIHEWWGLNDWITANADTFARKGYAALAIDLYRGQVAASSDEAHELMRGLPEDRVVKDLHSAFAFLSQQRKVRAERIGAIGWCMGGSYGLVAAMEIPHLSASVICYGRLVTERAQIAKLNCPVLGIFGESDKGIPVPSVKAFERTAQMMDKDVRTSIYPGVGHAFMNPGNTRGYSKEAADDAWQRIFTFFEKKLIIH